MRTSIIVNLEQPEQFKEQLLTWAEQFEEVVYLDSNAYIQNYTSYEMVMAVEALTLIKTDTDRAFQKLDEYQSTTKDWLFGYLSYDLKNDTESLSSNNYDGLNFPDLFFFQPKRLFLLKGNLLEICYLNMISDEIESDLRQIRSTTPNSAESNNPKFNISQRISKENYINSVLKILEHIKRGDIYETNFCLEFYAENARINPLEVYKKLNNIAQPPFAAYLRSNNHYVLCSSPERFLRNENGKIISQPIKGTAKRDNDLKTDDQIQRNLTQNEKELSENIMIVDLVRNDLSRTAQKASVRVEELCQPYRFKQVHHLISTITSKKSSEYSIIDVIKNAFPMGSMTGAPKISAMQIIEKVEATKRGIYSGAIGYFTPEGNFDFNVVIRSILYHSETQYLSFSVGSAITALCSPEKEYEECLLKAQAMKTVLESF